MTVTLNIWSFEGKNRAWGHASLTLSDGTYISWWPKQPINMKNATQELAHRNRTFGDDVRGEDNKLPDIQIHITKLDEKAIKDWWLKFQSTYFHWSVSKNCSTVCAEALVAGGAYMWWYSLFAPLRINTTWTPSDVEVFANIIKQKLEE